MYWILGYMAVSRRGPDGTARININGTINGYPWTNVFWVNLAPVQQHTQGDLGNLLTAFVNAYKTDFQPCMHANSVFSTARIVHFYGGNLVTEIQQVMTGAGTLAGTNLADNSACYVMSWTSNVYWKGGKPRTYIPGVITGDMQDGSLLTPAAVTRNKTQAAAFHTNVQSLAAGAITSCRHGFVSFFTGGTARVPPLWFDITGGTAHSRLGSQRGHLGHWKP